MSPTSTSRIRRLAAPLLAAAALVGFSAVAAVQPGVNNGTSVGAVGTTALKHKTVYQASAGNDSTCRVNIKGRPCLTVAHACAIAHPNYVIYKINGPAPIRSRYSVACAPSGALANVWVDTNGGTCTYSSSPAAYSDAAACADPPAAYNATGGNVGQTIYIKGGTYTSQWNWTKTMATAKAGAPAGTCNYNYGGGSSLASCINIGPAPGENVTLNCSTGVGVCTSTTSVPGTQIQICAPFVWLHDITIVQNNYTETATGEVLSNQSVGIGSGDNLCGTSLNAHDDYLQNILYGGQARVGGGSTNVWLVGGEATGVAEESWNFGNGGGNGGVIPNTNHSGIVGVQFDGYNFINHSYPTHHMECLHDTVGSNHMAFADNRFLACPVESLFFQTLAGGSGGNNTPFQDTILIENNTFDGGGGNALKVDCTTNPNCVTSNFTIRNNSFNGSSFSVENACNSGGTCSGAVINNNVFYGNIDGGCPSINFGSGGASGTLWTTKYNVVTGTQAGICTGDATSVYSASAPSYLSPGTPNYDLHLNGSLQAADNLVPVAQVCPSVDADGTLRPQNTNCDSGAYERLLPFTPQSGSSQAVCSGGCSDPGYTPDSTAVACTNTVHAPTLDTTHHIVTMGAISNGSINECRQYGYLVPTGLNPSSSNQPAALIMANNPPRVTCGPSGNDEIKQTFQQFGDGAVAAANRYVIIVIEKPCNPNRGAWDHSAIDIPSGSSDSDGPMLTAVITDIESRFNIDPNRIYLAGSSSAGALVNGIACDPTYSTLFRGYAAEANTMPITGNTTTGPNNGTEVCAGTNHNFFYMNVNGDADTQSKIIGTCLATHCLASFDENRRFWAAHMGCNATSSGGGSGTTFGTPSSGNTDYAYSSCSFGQPAKTADAQKIGSGTHGTAGVTSTTYPGGTCAGCNDYYFQRNAWAYFAGSSW